MRIFHICVLLLQHIDISALKNRWECLSNKTQGILVEYRNQVVKSDIQNKDRERIPSKAIHFVPLDHEPAVAQPRLPMSFVKPRHSQLVNGVASVTMQTRHPPVQQLEQLGLFYSNLYTYVSFALLYQLGGVVRY